MKAKLDNCIFCNENFEQKPDKISCYCSSTCRQLHNQEMNEWEELKESGIYDPIQESEMEPNNL